MSSVLGNIVDCIGTVYINRFETMLVLKWWSCNIYNTKTVLKTDVKVCDWPGALFILEQSVGTLFRPFSL